VSSCSTNANTISTNSSALTSSSSTASSGTPSSANIRRCNSDSGAPAVCSMSARRWHSQSAKPAAIHNGMTTHASIQLAAAACKSAGASSAVIVGGAVFA